jgi:hypothetical protein
MDSMQEKIKMLVKEHPQKAMYLFEEWYDRMPEQAEEEIDNMLYGVSIRQQHTMEKAIHLAEKYTGRTKMWDYDTFKHIVKDMGINTEGKKYSLYDIDFVATFKYLIHNKTLSELNAKPQTYIKMALDELCLNSRYGYEHYQELKDMLEAD